MIEEWIAALEARNESGLELARLSYEAFTAADFDYDSLRRVLAERRYGLPEKPTLSKYKTAYQYWAIERKPDYERLKRVGLSKLYELAIFLRGSSADPDEWLDRAAEVSREELKAEMADQPLQQKRRTLQMPESIYEALESGANRLYQVNGFTGETLLPAVEFCAAILGGLPVETLQQLWREAHGEAA